jgi:predicted ATPase
MPNRVPLTLITGHLGAGKTTPVNALLRALFALYANLGSLRLTRETAFNRGLSPRKVITRGKPGRPRWGRAA